MPTKTDNPIQDHYENRLNPTALRDAENHTNNDYDTASNYEKTDDEPRENEDFDASTATNTAESTPSGDWDTNFDRPQQTKSFFDRVKGINLKKATPITFVATAIITIGIGISMIFSPTMILIHIKETILDRYNTQNTALDARANKMLAKKLTGTATASCGSVSLLKCKYTKMSNSMLQRLSDQGLVPYKDGKAMDLSGKWGNGRPDEFRPTSELKSTLNLADGVDGIKASEFNQFLKDNPKVTSIYRKAFNPRWEAFWDSTFTNFLDKIGFGTKKSKITGDDEKSVKASVEDNITASQTESPSKVSAQQDSADDNTTQAQADANNAASNSAAQDTDSLISDAATSTESELASKIKSKFANSSLAVVNLYCLAVNDAPKIAKALRVIQLGQLISFGLLFFQAADEIKAQQGDATKYSTIASLFTQSTVDSNGDTVKKSAMDSDAMKYALLGDTSFSSKTSDAQQWIPGGGFIQILYKIKNALTTGSSTVNSAISTVCNAISSPFGDIASLALDFTGIGLFATLSTTILTQTPLFESWMTSIFKTLAGKIVDSNIAYEDLGNAASIGMVLSLGEGANAGALMPLSVSDAVAYYQRTQEIRLADAKVDRASLSPFDISSPNTFMGSIVTQLIPYYSSASSSPLGAFGSMAQIVTSTFSSLTTKTSFADSNLTEATLTSCPDTGITSEGIAAGPICDVQYGIPVNYLDSIDPEENVTSLIASGDIQDDEDGTVVSGSNLENYLNKCQQGESTTTAECKIDTEEKARYALYYVDHRIQKNMDGEETYGGSTSTISTATDSTTSDTSSSLSAGSGTFTDSGEVAGYDNILYNAKQSDSVYGSSLVGIGRCAYVTSRAWHGAAINYGYGAARDLWDAYPQYQHKDRNPKKGALMFSKGTSVYGHVFIYLGNNKILNDGKIMDADFVEKTWKHTYWGWIDPADIGWTSVKTTDIKAAMGI